jgi:hypothetical protein
MPLQIRRAETEAERATLGDTQPGLAVGEPLFVVETGALYLGDGTNPGGVDVAPDETFDLSAYDGTIGVFPNVLIDAGVNREINLNGTIRQDVLPAADGIPETLNIGSSDYRFRKLYLSGFGLALGEAEIGTGDRPGFGTVVVLPQGSTLGNVGIQTELNPEVPEAISITALDSVPLINAVEGEIYLKGTFKDHIVPDTNNLRDLGEPTTKFRNLHLGGSVNLGLSEIYDDSGTLTFGSTTYEIEPKFYLDGERQGLILNATTQPATVFFPKINFEAQRGSSDSPLAVADNDYLGSISVEGYNGASYVVASSVAFKVDDAAITTSSTNIKSEVFIGDPVEIFNETGKYLKVSADGRVAGASFTVGAYAAGDEPTNAVKGMIIFDDTTGRFKGFTGTAWVDFHV